MSADPNYQPIVLEKRIHPRQKVLRFLPGKLYREDDLNGDQIPCRPLDVSAMGLGIFTEEELEEGDRLILRLQGEDVELIVVWMMESPGETVGFRYGLKAKQAGVNLEEIFARHNC